MELCDSCTVKVSPAGFRNRLQKNNMKIEIITGWENFMSASETPQPIRGALGASSVGPRHMKWTASDVDGPQTNC
jgi:hypothetical protein